jgi:tRNA dimethylallyltransferase
MTETSLTVAIVGPTATGKTKLALELAEWWLTKSDVREQLTGVDLLSADSRQIYQGIEIISGADIPVAFQRVNQNPDQLAVADPSIQTALKTYFEKKQSEKTIRLWGVACLPPQLSWSAGQFQAFGKLLLQQAQKNHRAVVIVGGTGLYQQVLWQKDWPTTVAPNELFRTKAEDMTVTELQAWLAELAPEKLAQLNESDRANPRRLLRQLELAAHLTKNPFTQTDTTSSTQAQSAPWPTIGLTQPLELQATVITQRVEERLKLGALAEATQLNPESTQPNVLSALGVRELRELAAEKLDLDQTKLLWSRRELQYAKRQITWWKKRPRVTWLTATDSDLCSKVTPLLEVS